MSEKDTIPFSQISRSLQVWKEMREKEARVLESVAFLLWYMEYGSTDFDDYDLDDPDIWKYWTKIRAEQDAPHCGDCTNVPMTCTRCFNDSLTSRARRILKGELEWPFESA